MDLKAFMDQGFGQYGLDISEPACAALLAYMDILLEWNEKMNLTAIVDKEQIVTKHFADSLILMNYMDLNGLSVIDVGTGAGFPGLPLKIACEGASLVLMDSLNKRVNFLKAVIDGLQLEHVAAYHSRAEESGRNPAHREQYDLAVSRAVARLHVLCEYCMPFVKKGGVFVAYKGYDVEEELSEASAAVEKLGGTVERVEKIRFGEDFSRSLVFIRKVRQTPPAYPRNAGVISKKPLI